MEAAKVVAKLNELYPQLAADGISARVIPRDEQWLVFFEKGGHEEAVELPRDFVSSCIEQGLCHLFREGITRALGRLMEAAQSSNTSAAMVTVKLKQLVPGLNDPDVTIAVSEDEPAWSFFMTTRGANRPVEFKLPPEVVERCLLEDDCIELRKAAIIAWKCLRGV